MIVEAVIISGYTLIVYYCPDGFYRLCITSDLGTAIDFKDVFYCSNEAIKQGKAIIKTIA
ncbi:MAG: hypothetical protein Tsb0014_08130 [Pleurocapsa sp.]